jgi:hypothetical protein
MLLVLLGQARSAEWLLMGADHAKWRLAYPISRTDTGHPDRCTHFHVAYQKSPTGLRQS